MEPLNRPRVRARPYRRRWVTRLWLAAGRVGAVGVILLVGAYVVLPWLGRRGDLNSVFEEIVRSALSIDVEIASIDTEPLSRLKVTRLRSVAASEAGKIDFEVSEIAFRYDPVALWNGRLQYVSLAGPTMFLNLDADLSGIARVPPAPSPPGSAPPKRRAPNPARYLPMTIGTAVIRSGDVRLQLAGRIFELDDLRVEVQELGRRTGQRFLVEAGLAGAQLVARGALDVRGDVTGGDRAAGAPAPRFVVSDATVEITGLPVRQIATWAKPAATRGGDHAKEGSAFARALATSSATVDLIGRFAGTWPDEVELRLETTAAALESPELEGVRVRSEDARLTLTARATGEFERVAFDLVTESAAALVSDRGETRERLRIVARGEYDRSADAEGLLRLDRFAVEVPGHGKLEVSGIIRAVGSGAVAELELDASARGLHGAGIAQLFLPPGPVRELVALAGPLDFDVRTRGAALAPSLAGTAALPLAHPDGGLALVELRFDGLTFERDGLEVVAETIRMGIETDELAPLLERLPARLRPATHGWAITGELRAAVEANGVGWTGDELVGDFNTTWTLASGHVAREDLWAEATELEVAARVGTTLAPGALEHQFTAETTVRLGEFLVGDIAGAPGDEAATARATGVWSGWPGGVAGVRVDELTLATPITGDTRGSLRWQLGGDAAESPGEPDETTESTSRVELDVETVGVPLPRAWDVFLREPLQRSLPLLAESSLVGVLGFDAQVRLPPRADEAAFTARARLTDGRLRLGGLRVEGLAIDLPVSSRGPRTAGPSARDRSLPGRVAAQRLDAWGWRVDELVLPLRYRDGVYGTVGPTTWPLFGGSFRLRDLEFSPRAPRGATWRIDARLDGVDLGRLSRSQGGPNLEGRIGGTLEPLRLGGSRIEWSGELVIDAFGGRVTFGDLLAEDVFTPYASFELKRGTVENVRLDELGQALRFGVASGVLSGTVDDLEVVGGELARLRLDVATVPVRGVNQYLDRRAIESIRRVLEGPLGALEETFFSRFWFDEFGFSASLDGDSFRLKGKSVEGGVEYIVLGRWYQFPRISIINANPGQEYDWARIRQNIAEIWEDDGEDSASDDEAVR